MAYIVECIKPKKAHRTFEVIFFNGNSSDY